jgi:hypothetical protein
MLSLEYIAGCIDCDGSISISISENRYKNKSGNASPQFAFVINFRQVQQYKYIVEEIRDTLGVGAVYDHAASSNTSTAMSSWQTTKHEETVYVCRLLQPYLHIKQKEADLMIEALDLWLGNIGERKGVGYSRPDWVKDRVREIASQMNPSQQKESSRRNQEIRRILVDPLAPFFEQEGIASVNFAQGLVGE